MKKIYICLMASLFVLSGCYKEKVEIEKKEEFKKVEEKIEKKKNPILVGMYTKKNGSRILTKEYTSPFVLNKDIGVFSTFYTVEEQISGNPIKEVWNQYFKLYKDITSYKIGYQISFETINKINIKKTILKPEDTQSFYDYMQVYLYDDIHQEDGAFYTHIEKEKEETLLTSIKLTGSTLTHEITSPITLIAFIYEEDDLNNNKEYEGQNTFKTTIYRKE